MAWFQNNCRYTEEYEPEHTYTFTAQCVVTGEPHSVTVKGADLFKYNRGEYIQDAFPYLTPGDREFLMSGVSPKGWSMMFGTDAPDEEEADADYLV